MLVVTLALVATLTFLLTFVTPGDPARILVGPKGTETEVAEVRSELGLDDPLVVQYGRYVSRVVRLDFGYSYSNREPVVRVIVERLPWTLLLATGALSVQLLIGIPLGLILARRPGGVADHVALGWALIMISLPVFFLGLMLLYVFAYRYRIFPLGGTELPEALVLPALALGLPGAAWYSRIMRSSASEVLNSDFVRSLRAKGMPPRTIVFKHTLRTALSPLLTMMAIDFGFLLGGAVIIERVFEWPGIGLTAFQALRAGDTAMLMGCVIVGSCFVLFMNLIADFARVAVDPRVAPCLTNRSSMCASSSCASLSTATPS